MGPRQIQQLIHSEKENSFAIWSGYKEMIQESWNEVSRKDDFNDHVVREFGKKLESFNLSSNLSFEGTDAGFRLKIASLSGLAEDPIPPVEDPIPPAEQTFLYVASSSQQNWNQVKFYDPQITNNNGKTIYYDETDTYALWNAGASKYISLISQIDAYPPEPRFYYNSFDDTVTGSYFGTAGWSGTVTIVNY